MPRKRRRAKPRHRVEALSPSLRAFMETGDYAAFRRDRMAEGENWLDLFDIAASIERGPGRGRALWELHREELLRDWIVTHPGTRPHSWWIYEAAEPRRVLEDPSHRVVQPQAPGDWDFVWHGHRGIRFHGNVKRPGDEPIVVESEPAYLERGGFLAEGERDRIPNERFDPEEIDDLTLATGHFERASDDRLRADSNQKGSAA